jgi:hypothetical protein
MSWIMTSRRYVHTHSPKTFSVCVTDVNRIEIMANDVYLFGQDHIITGDRRCGQQ